MDKFVARLSRMLAYAISALVILGFGSSKALAASFVDPVLGEVTPEKRVTIAAPQPVQLLFTFNTNGKANARATDWLKAEIVSDVKGSGKFSEVSEAPVANGAVLSITIDNVVDLKAAKAAGVSIGLTFGLKGKVVTENYVGLGEYIRDANAGKITRTVPHSLHTSIGLAKLPEGVTGVKIEEAVKTMARQLVDNLINELARDPEFLGKAAAPAEPPAAPAAQ